MKEELAKIVKDQQSLQDVLIQLQLICQELDLDFDSALGSVDIDVDETPLCPHDSAFPSANGAVFCPECKGFLVGSGSKVNLAQENLWR